VVCFFFCEGERSACFCDWVVKVVSEVVGEVEVDARLRLDDEVCLEVDDDDEVVDGGDEAEGGCIAGLEDDGDDDDKFIVFPVDDPWCPFGDESVS